jgi:hypothetical protein
VSTDPRAFPRPAAKARRLTVRDIVAAAIVYSVIAAAALFGLAWVGALIFTCTSGR